MIHCDLKPENILLPKKGQQGESLKIIDLGSSCFYSERLYTYIQSRFYRAPEIILGLPYTAAIDMWSFGCIVAELFVGFPIFPGESEKEQLALQMQFRGVPPIDVLEQSTRAEMFFEDLKPDEDGTTIMQTIQPIPVTSGQTGEEYVPNTKSVL